MKNLEKNKQLRAFLVEAHAKFSEKTASRFKAKAKTFLGNFDYYDEYETVDIAGVEYDIHNYLLCLIYENV